MLKLYPLAVFNINIKMKIRKDTVIQSYSRYHIR